MTDVAQLVSLVQQLRDENEQLRERVADLEATTDRNEELQAENEQLQATIAELQAGVKELSERVTELEATEDTQSCENCEQLDASIEQLETDNERLQEENQQLRDRVSSLEATVAAQPDIEIDPDEKEPITTLTVEGLPVGRRIAGSISEYDWEAELRPQLEADLRESTESTDAPTTPADELTHIERISRAAGDDISSVTDSVAARRAVALWRNLPKWGSKTPKGYCLRPKDNPKRLLEADQDEDLAWKQYYRAAEALESLSEGAVTFFDSDTHGKMLVLHEQSEAFDRLRASLTPSTAHAEG
jgi:regulator of replication initiation timing